MERYRKDAVRGQFTVNISDDMMLDAVEFLEDYGITDGFELACQFLGHIAFTSFFGAVPPETPIDPRIKRDARKWTRSVLTSRSIMVGNLKTRNAGKKDMDRWKGFTEWEIEQLESSTPCDTESPTLCDTESASSSGTQRQINSRTHCQGNRKGNREHGIASSNSNVNGNVTAESQGGGERAVPQSTGTRSPQETPTLIDARNILADHGIDPGNDDRRAAYNMWLVETDNPTYENLERYLVETFTKVTSP